MANHQIRAFRAIFIQDTIPFLQEYFRRKIDKGVFQVESSKEWYLSVANKNNDNNNTTARGLWPVTVMFKGLIALLLQHEQPDRFPDTFIFDSERLWALRSTLQGLINLEVCWSIFESCVRRHNLPSSVYANFCARIWTLTEDDNNYDDSNNENDNTPWLRNLHSISLEIARFVCAATVRGNAHGRHVMVPDKVIEDIQTKVERHFLSSSEESDMFKQYLGERLISTTCAYAEKYMDLSPLSICDSQRSSRFLVAAQSSSSSGGGVGVPFSAWQCQHDIERIGMRLAHIGVLHWRVWAPILYMQRD